MLYLYYKRELNVANDCNAVPGHGEDNVMCNRFRLCSQIEGAQSGKKYIHYHLASLIMNITLI